MALGSTQPLTEMSKKRPARRAHNLAAIYEPNVWKCGILNLSQPLGPPRPVQWKLNDYNISWDIQIQGDKCPVEFSGQLHAPTALTPGKEPPVPIV
jgi:hypothetical protein